MNITTTQATIIDTLRDAGLPVQGWEVKNAVPPIVVVCPAIPSIETTNRAGITHGHPFMTNWMIQIVAGRGTDTAVRDALNDMTARALLALTPHMRDIEVETPKFTDTSEGKPQYLGAEIAASIAIDMKEE